MTSESLIQDRILLACGKLDHVRIHRQHAGKVAVVDWDEIDRLRKAGVPFRTMNLAPAGAADLAGVIRDPCPVCCTPLGRSLQIEVKTTVGKVSPDQQRYHEVYRSLGALVIVARSPEDAIAQICAPRTTTPRDPPRP